MKVLILVLAVYQQLVTSHDIKYTALKFGKDATSYILMQPDFTSLREEFSICSWVRRMSDHRRIEQYWLSYASANRDEIDISDTARYVQFIHGTSYTAPTKKIGEWNHICATWDYSTRKKRVYYNGEQIGMDETPSGRKLNVPGSLMLGQLHWGYGGGDIQSCCYFGGELYDMNVFSTQLSAEQVKEMYTQGRCANYSQTFGQSTFLRWKDVLLEEKHGSVTDVELVECNSTHTHPEEDETKDDKDNTGIWQFLRGKKYYNRVVSEVLLSDMSNRLELLGEFKNHSIDDALIAHLEKHHSDGDPGKDTEDSEDEESGEEADSMDTDS